MILSEIGEKILELSGKKKYLSKELSDLRIESHTLEDDKLVLEKAQIFLQECAKETQEKLRVHIQDIVQLCLDMCWEGEIDFDIRFRIKNGSTVAELVFVIGEDEISPMDHDGGGLVQVAAFALRVATWTLSTTRSVMILDEPFGALDETLQPLAARMLRELSDKLEMQFIIVTHRLDMRDIADKIFHVKRKEIGNFQESSVTSEIVERNENE